MSSNEYHSDVMEFTPGQVLASKISSAALGVLLVVWYVLVATKVVPLPFWQIVLGSALICIGLSLLICGLIERNAVALWLSFCFLVPGALSVLCRNVAGCNYYELYPLYIAIPAIASFFTMLVCGKFKSHLKVIPVFAVPALLFALTVFTPMPILAAILATIAWAIGVVVFIIVYVTRSAKDE